MSRARKIFTEEEQSGLPFRYIEQQKIIDNYAISLGSVAFRPDYHRAKGDKNTVLVYTKDDEAHNREVDLLSKNYVVYTRAEANDRPYPIDDKFVYRDPYWTFENTDVNGFLDYGFANFGKLDLRGPDWLRVIMESMANARIAKNKEIAETHANEEEQPEDEKEYCVKVTTVTHLCVMAKSKEEAIEKAFGEAWEHDADEINGEIIDEENEE